MPTLTETVAKYLDANSSVRAEKSRTNHVAAAAKLTGWLGRDPELAELTDELPVRWWREREKQVARNTVHSEALLTLAVLKWASRKRWCEWPDARPPSRVRRAPQALSLEEVQSLLRAADSLAGAYKGVPACVRWRAYLTLALATGERIGAIKQLEWRDFDGELVTIRPETRKGGCVESVHRLPSGVVAALGVLKSYGEPTPFGWMQETAVYAHWHALRQLAGLPEWCRPHSLRKTAASHCRTLGDARRLLGHSSTAVTLRHYRDPRIADESPASALMEALARPRRRSWLGWLVG